MLLQDLIGAAVLVAYYLVFLFLVPSLLKGLLRVPGELVRKIQHIAYCLSVFVLLEMFSAWYQAIAAIFLLVLVAYPALWLMEKRAWYGRALTDRAAKGGELRKQLLYAEISFAVLIFVFWGLLGPGWRYVVAVAAMALGSGDAAAALVGKAFGRHRILHYMIEKGKTCEGTGAMVAFAGLGIFLTLLVYARKLWYLSLMVSIIVAPVCGIVELFSRRGIDTLTVPVSAAFLTLPLVYLFSLLGW
ncbi:MAG: phosphatidate cytidylyltransferase [Bacillota bacterium]